MTYERIFYNFFVGGEYPKVDLGIWLRSCIKEVTVPIEGRVSGKIPTWITGELLQNGPGKFYFGEDVFKHLFDGSALLQKYSISQGKVHYQCRYFFPNPSIFSPLKAIDSSQSGS